jgi:hypothetical protein
MDFKSYSLLGFEVGKGNKKYIALLKNKETGKIKKISFGDKRYQHYHDKVLKVYSHLNHYDEKRRSNYRSRRLGPNP